MKKGNFIAAGLFAALAIYIIWECAAFPASKAKVPGPAVYPTAVAVLMLMAAISLVITTLRMRPQDDKTLDLFNSDKLRVYLCMGILVAYIPLVQMVGFFTMSSVLLFGLIKWFGKYKFHICALSAIAVSGIIYFVFKEVLHVPFRFGVLM